jgi:L-histidine N-alpha-methyltransferase
MEKLTKRNRSFSESPHIEVINHLDFTFKESIQGDMQQGLRAQQKFIPSKYFYDERGSKLFEDICELPEYYPTCTELSILKKIAPQIMCSIRFIDLIELGSGSSYKIQILMNAASESNRATMRYIPVDISESAVLKAAQGLIKIYPELQVMGIVADFTNKMDFVPTERSSLFMFFGSTIGNFRQDEAIAFLRNISDIMKIDDSLLIGFDMIKPKGIIEAAYNDSQGITSEFNKNILHVVNDELNANFDPLLFDHLAFYSDAHERIEMHLRANCDCTVIIKELDMEVTFKKGETIHTENSKKFSRKRIESIIGEAELSIKEWFCDPDEWFSVLEVVLARD